MSVLVDLSADEIRTLLWHVHIVDAAYGDEPPAWTTTAVARAKLLLELAYLESVAD